MKRDVVERMKTGNVSGLMEAGMNAIRKADNDFSRYGRASGLHGQLLRVTGQAPPREILVASATGNPGHLGYLMEDMDAAEREGDAVRLGRMARELEGAHGLSVLLNRESAGSGGAGATAIPMSAGGREDSGRIAGTQEADPEGTEPAAPADEQEGFWRRSWDQAVDWATDHWGWARAGAGTRQILNGAPVDRVARVGLGVDQAKALWRLNQVFDARERGRQGDPNGISPEEAASRAPAALMGDNNQLRRAWIDHYQNQSEAISDLFCQDYGECGQARPGTRGVRMGDIGSQ